MVYKSDDLWAAGSPEPPYIHQAREFLHANDHTYFRPNEVADEIFNLTLFEEAIQDIPEDQVYNAMNERFRFDMHAEILLERLVENGQAEKRAIRVSDQMDALQDEHPEPFEEAGLGKPVDFSGKRTPFYRAATTE